MLTIGIPSFVLALAPSEGPLYRGRLLRALAAFAVPAGVGIGVGSLLSYGLVDGIFGGTLNEGRTAATTTLIVLGLAFILLLERGPGRDHIAIQSYMLAMVTALGGLYAAILAVEPLRAVLRARPPDRRSVVHLHALGGGRASSSPAPSGGSPTYSGSSSKRTRPDGRPPPHQDRRDDRPRLALAEDHRAPDLGRSRRLPAQLLPRRRGEPRREHRADPRRRRPDGQVGRDRRRPAGPEAAARRGRERLRPDRGRQAS